MRFDTVSYNLNLAEDETCFYHAALQKTSRPMCLGVSDRAVFISRERFLKFQAYTMERIPLADVKEVILGRERGTWAWLKWAIVLCFGVLSMATMGIGLWLAPDLKPNLIGVGGPIAFTVVGLAMLLDSRWRLVLTIRTGKKDWRWRPNIFDKHDEVKALREGFLDACRYIRIPTRRLDLANGAEIQAFWRWFGGHARNGRIDLSAVHSKLHGLCDRLGIELDIDIRGNHNVIITAGYAEDAFPIVEELVLAAPKMPKLSVTAFKPPRKAERSYLYDGVECSIDKVFFVPFTDGFYLSIVVFADLENIDPEAIWPICRDLLGEYEAVLGIQNFEIADRKEVGDDTVLRHISTLFEVVEDFHRLDF